MHAGSVAPRGRGAAAGSLTAVLAAVAHAWAGGAAPSGAGTALLAALALALGGVAATATFAATMPGMLLILAVGQIGGHLLLGAAGHSHGAPHATGPAMLTTHAIAVLACAVLIAAAGRFGEALSRAVRSVSAPPAPAAPTGTDTVVFSADQPLQAASALAVSLSHRGPPAVVR